MPTNTQVAAGSRHKRQLPPAVAFPALSLILFTYFFSASAPSPAFVYLQQQWHFSASLLTVAFGVYAIALLLALVITGSLSDHIGRKPVIFTALILQALSMAMFLMADNITALIEARVVQGLATGIATGSLSAAVVEAAPEHRKKLGALISSVSPLAGLAAGALVSGLALNVLNHPVTMVFSVLTAVFLLGAAILIFVPETVIKQPGALTAMIPHVSVPQAARTAFWRGVPVLITTWAMGGLYLALAPSIVLHVFNTDNCILNGLAITTLSGVGAVAPFLLKRLELPKAAMISMAIILIGLVLTITALSIQSLSLFFVATALSGIGFGGGFSAVIQILAPKAQVNDRAALFAAVFIVSYLSLSLPAMLAGLLVKPLGLSFTVVMYARLLFAMACIGMLLQWQALKELRLKN